MMLCFGNCVQLHYTYNKYMHVTCNLVATELKRNFIVFIDLFVTQMFICFIIYLLHTLDKNIQRGFILSLFLKRWQHLSSCFQHFRGDALTAHKETHLDKSKRRLPFSCTKCGKAFRSMVSHTSIYASYAFISHTAYQIRVIDG